MTLLKTKEIVAMDEKARKEKMKDLKMELIRANVSANKQNAKTKEIRKAIARIETIERNKVNTSKEALKRK